jgi:RNA polymerase sigma factor (sigma-70 family)
MSKFETSLNVTAGFEDGEEIIEFITDDTDKNAETLFYSKEIKSVINNALASLSERQRNFIVLHFGLNGNEKMQLSDIAIKFDTSVAIVSKDIQRAIKILKIRHGEILRDFV